MNIVVFQACQVDYTELNTTLYERLNKIVENFGHGNKGNRLCGKTKSLIARAYAFSVSLNKALLPIVDLPDPIIFTSCITGFDKRTIRTNISQFVALDRILPPCSPVKPLAQSRKRVAARIAAKIPEFCKDLMVSKIHSLYKQGTRVAISALNKDMKASLEGQFEWTHSDKSMARILYGCGFKFQAVRDRVRIYERKELSDWRARYLKQIKWYRNNDYFLVFLDETWVFEGMGTKRTWINQNALSTLYSLVDNF